MLSRALTVSAVLLLAAACGGDDEPEVASTSTEAPPATEAELPEDACSVIPDAAEVTGIELGAGVPAGADVRRVCAASTADGSVGLTFAVQSGGRFDEKAEQSEAALGEGEAVDGVGDRALFLFDDEDLPEGVGGLLVELGDLSIEVTLQGLDEAAMRDAAVALGGHAVDNLS